MPEELPSVRGDHGNTIEIHPAGNILKQSPRVSIAPSSDHRRRPKSRPDLQRSEDPDRLILATDDRSDLVCLELRDLQSRGPSVVKSTTRISCPFQPAIDRILCDLRVGYQQSIAEAQ